MDRYGKAQPRREQIIYAVHHLGVLHRPMLQFVAQSHLATHPLTHSLTHREQHGRRVSKDAYEVVGELEDGLRVGR